ncbi:MAG: hypothetical protein VR64_20485 [Desulfatitalea sp. BRH_c12]|nr:MAG: hypothetical protein VR64_20485 [Desulfatitalea sp. BRH_c12]
MKRNSGYSKLFFLFILTLLFSCGGGGSGGSDAGGNPPDPDLAPAQVLAAFGIPTDPGQRSGPDGNELPETFHPLRRARATVGAMQEIFMTTRVSSASAQGWGGVFEDAATGGGNELPLYTSNTWEYFWCGDNCGHRAGKGDIDGDDRDEIVVVAWVPSLAGGQLRLTVVDYGPAGYTTTVTPLASNIGRRFDLLFPDDLMSLAVGDFDDDGLDEIAFTLFNYIWVFDDALHGHAQLARAELSPPGAQWPVAMVRLAAGRFYADGVERLVAAYNFREGHLGDSHSGVWIRIFDDARLDVQYSAYHAQIIGPQNEYLLPKWINLLDTGDLDADGLDEIVLSNDGKSTATGTITSTVAVLRRNAAGDWGFGKWVQADAGIVLDWDGDGFKEVFGSMGTDELGIFAYDGTTGALTWNRFSVTIPLLGDITYGVPPVAGDIDGDGMDEIVMVDSDLWQYTLERMETPQGEASLKHSRTFVARTGNFVGSLVLANLDDDGLVVEYTGQSAIGFTDPQVLAVLAAPPTYQDKGQDGSTTYGRTVGSTVEQATSIGTSAGFGVKLGLEGNLPGLPIGGEISVKRSVKESMNYTASTTSEFRTSSSFTSGVEDDAVVFTIVPFDIYYYDVVGAADPSLVGTTVTVNLPREPYTLFSDRTFFNAHNGPGQDIGSEVLAHRVGNPFSYPTEAEREQHLAMAVEQGLTLAPDGSNAPNRGGWLNPALLTVGPNPSGSWCGELRIEQGYQSCVGSEFEHSEELEATATFMGSGGSASMESSTQISLTKATSEGFFVEGQICAILPSQYDPGMLYRAGIYAYPQRVANRTFLVVNYWVTR